MFITYRSQDHPTHHKTSCKAQDRIGWFYPMELVCLPSDSSANKLFVTAFCSTTETVWQKPPHPLADRHLAGADLGIRQIPSDEVCCLKPQKPVISQICSDQGYIPADTLYDARLG